jgi:hypothetical protein
VRLACAHRLADVLYIPKSWKTAHRGFENMFCIKAYHKTGLKNCPAYDGYGFRRVSL